MNTEKAYMIFKDDNGKYKVGLSHKNQNGEYQKAYFPVHFKKGVELENQTQIYIKNYWLDFYNWEYQGKKGTTFYLFINEYKLLDEAINPPKEERTVKTDDIEIKDDDLPF